MPNGIVHITMCDMATHANITIRDYGETVTIPRAVEVAAIARIEAFYATTTPQERTALYWFRVASAPHAYLSERRRPKRRLGVGTIAFSQYMRNKTRMTDTEWMGALRTVGRVLAAL